MFIEGMLLGIGLGIIVMLCMSIETINDYINQKTKLLNDYENLLDENINLKNTKINAEKRATEYARKIKQIEDITLKQGQGTIVDRFDKIKEVIVGQNK